ncbi:MAG TPA: hypothetical protein VH165_03720 [Kofleriaceae bacterium]|nr:hypothetical protein [Kofleriaceae bacterium]
MTTKIDHAHDPLDATFELWFPNDQVPDAEVPERVQALVDALCTGAGPLATLRMAGHLPAWRDVLTPAFAEAHLTIGVAFDDLQAGCTALAAVASAAGARLQAHVFEAQDEHDPFAHLRPCQPPPRPPTSPGE